MVSEKKMSKQGITLIRKTVRKGDEARHLLSAGAGLTLLHSLKAPESNHSNYDQPQADEIVIESAAMIAAGKHIRKVTTRQGKPPQSLSEKIDLNASNPHRRRSTEVPIVAPKVDAPILIDQFLSGTPIFFKAILALQSRSGGYLTIDDLDITASNRTALPTSQFTIMNAESITDDGNMIYGNAIWLVFDNRRVLGSQWSGFGETRKLGPALIRCTKEHIVKAHHIGRWIVMHRDNPIGMLGKPCLHGDRMMLEQEWRFLSCSSPNEVTLYKTKNSITDGIKQANEIDFFEPIEDCSWRVRLVAQKDMGTTDGKARMELTTRANTQLVTSLTERWRLKDDLFGLLADKIDNKIEYDKVNTSLKHKLSSKLEKEHLMGLYHSISAKEFKQYSHFNTTRHLESNFVDTENLLVPAVAPLERKDSVNKFVRRPSIDGRSQSASPARGRFNSSEIGGYKGGSLSPKKSRTRQRELDRFANDEQVERMLDDYWRCAQSVLVTTSAWAQLDTAMHKYYNGPNKKLKESSAFIIQKFLRRRCKFSGMIGRRMHTMDIESSLRLSMENKKWQKEFKKRMRAKIKKEKTERLRLVMEPYHENGSSDMPTPRRASSVTDFMTVDLTDFHPSKEGSVHSKEKGGSVSSKESFIHFDSPKKLLKSSSFAVEDGTIVFYRSGYTPHDSTHSGSSINSRTVFFPAPIKEEREIKTGKLSEGNSFAAADRGLTFDTLERSSSSNKFQLDNPFGQISSKDVPHSPMSLKDVQSSPRNPFGQVSLKDVPHSPVSRARPQTALPRLQSTQQPRIELKELDQEGQAKLQRQEKRRQARKKRAEEKELQQSQTAVRLGMTPDNPAGLPADVFEGMQSKVSSTTGLNFLRVASLHPDVFSESKSLEKGKGRFINKIKMASSLF